MGSKHITIAITFIVFSFAAFGQAVPSVLDLQKAIDLGIANSKLLKASSEKIKIASAKIRETNTQQLPSVKVSSNYTRISDNITPFSVKFPNAPAPVVLNPQILNQYSESAGLSQLIYAGGRVKRTLKSLDFLEQASTIDLENDRQALVMNVISAYYSLYKLQQTKKILKENEQLLQARIRDLGNLEQAGIVLRNDVLKLELSLSQIKYQELDISDAYDATIYGLNILIGLPDFAKYELDTTSFFKFKLDRSFDEYVTGALSARPDLKAADLRLTASKYTLMANKSNVLPTVSGAANYNYLRPNQRVFPNRDQFDDTWSAGVTLSWDISSLYNNRHYVAEAQHSYNQTYQLKVALADNVKTELYSNYLAYQKANEHLTLSNATLSQAEENYRLINDRLQDHVVVAADLQDALNYLVQSQLNVLVDKAEIDLAYFRFIKSTGTITTKQ